MKKQILCLFVAGLWCVSTFAGEESTFLRKNASLYCERVAQAVAKKNTGDEEEVDNVALGPFMPSVRLLTGMTSPGWECKFDIRDKTYKALFLKIVALYHGVFYQNALRFHSLSDTVSVGLLYGNGLPGVMTPITYIPVYRLSEE